MTPVRTAGLVAPCASSAGMRINTPDREAFDFFRALIVALPIGLGLWAAVVVGLFALR